jgi:hypothetical protein
MRPNAWDDAAGCSRTVQRLARELNKMKTHFNTEEKWLYGAGSGSVTNALVFTSTNVCAQGLDDGDRVGDSIKCFRFNGKYTFKIGASATTPAICTLLIVLKKNVLGATSAASRIFMNEGTPQVRAKPYMKNFDILYIKHFTLVPGTDSAAKIIEISFPLNLHTIFSGDTAAITDCQEGLIQMAVVSDQSSNQPSFTYKNVVEYVDD